MKLFTRNLIITMAFVSITAFISVAANAEWVEFQITTNTANQDFPAIYGDTVVWEDQRNSKYNIYGYNLSTSTEFQISTNTAYQSVPAIYGGTVVWQDERNGNDDIYGATFIPEPGTMLLLVPALLGIAGVLRGRIGNH